MGKKTTTAPFKKTTSENSLSVSLPVLVQNQMYSEKPKKKL